MRVSRIYLPAAIECGSNITLPDELGHYVVNVLRLKSGAAITLFNGQGGEYVGVLSRVEKRRVEVKVEEYLSKDVESPLDITLAQGVSRGERMDYTLQKVVELGVTKIIPLITERTVVNIKGDRRIKRREHWQGVVKSACEQSGRNIVPEVEELATMDDWMQKQGAGLQLVLHHRTKQGLNAMAYQGGPITLLIGPEGGLSQGEIEFAQDKGFIPVCLGPRVLRTETAAVAALAAMQVLWGDAG